MDSNSGIVLSSYKPKQIANSILNFSKMKDSELIKIGDNGRKFYLNNFSIKKRKQQLLSFFK